MLHLCAAFFFIAVAFNILLHCCFFAAAFLLLCRIVLSSLCRMHSATSIFIEHIVTKFKKRTSHTCMNKNRHGAASSYHDMEKCVRLENLRVCSQSSAGKPKNSRTLHSSEVASCTSQPLGGKKLLSRERLVCCSLSLFHCGDEEENRCQALIVLQENRVTIEPWGSSKTSKNAPRGWNQRVCSCRLRRTVFLVKWHAAPSVTLHSNVSDR